MIEIAALALAGCIAIAPSSDRITVGDLAVQLPGLESAVADRQVSFAPAPGVRRIFTVSELNRIAARWSAPVAPRRDLCFERPVAALDPEKILEAMRQQLPGARIEILETCRTRAPQGPVEFPLAGLHATPSGSLWMGFVIYAGNRRFNTWARVNVLVTAARVVATGYLKAGQPIDAAQLRIESREEFPAGDAFAQSLEQVAGKLLRRGVPAGTAIRSLWLESPPDVVRGGTVKVEVRRGAAVVEFEGVAETSGTAGQTVSVTNPSSGKRFRAIVQGPAKVMLRNAP